MWNTIKCQARCEKFDECFSSWQHPFLFLIRLYWGWGFFQAGWGKFGKMDEVIGFFTTLNIPMPEILAYTVATVETVGGLLLLLGLAARVIAMPLIVIMVTALFTAHAEATYNIFNDAKTFFEQAPVLFLYACLLVLIFGPGKWSLDHMLCGKSDHKGVEL